MARRSQPTTPRIDSDAPITEKQFFQTWIQANTAELGPALRGRVLCSNAACGKVYRADDGIDLDRLRIACPHCRPKGQTDDQTDGQNDNHATGAHAHGTSLAWTGQGFTCGCCKRRLPVKYREFYKNAGLLLSRWTDEVGGLHCRRCIDVHFIEGTLVSGLVGWFGVVSLVLNPFLIAANFVRYITTIGMPAAYPATPADMQMRSRIDAEMPGILAAIEGGSGYQKACDRAARRLRVSPIDVRLALQDAQRDRAAADLRRLRG